MEKTDPSGIMKEVEAVSIYSEARREVCYRHMAMTQRLETKSSPRMGGSNKEPGSRAGLGLLSTDDRKIVVRAREQAGRPDAAGKVVMSPVFI